MKFLIYATSGEPLPEKIGSFDIEHGIELCQSSYRENEGVVEVNTLEDLMKFCDVMEGQHGEIVFGREDYKYHKPFIELYDTWRE